MPREDPRPEPSERKGRLLWLADMHACFSLKNTGDCLKMGPAFPGGQGVHGLHDLENDTDIKKRAAFVGRPLELSLNETLALYLSPDTHKAEKPGAEQQQSAREGD
jgi:hypothetical protein